MEILIQQGLKQLKDSRTASIKRFLDNNPGSKYSSISAIFSKSMGNVAKENNENPADYKQKRAIKPQFNKAMNAKVNIKPDPADVKPPMNQNPQAGGQQVQGGPVIGQPLAIPPITTDTAGSLFAGIYGFIQLFNSNLPDLTTDEKEDSGIMAKPLIESTVKTERGVRLLCVGGLATMVIKKGKQARAISQEKKDKEKKLVEKTEPNIEPTVEPPKPKKAKPTHGPPPPGPNDTD